MRLPKKTPVNRQLIIFKMLGLLADYLPPSPLQILLRLVKSQAMKA
jgi:hypothetical protein